MTFLFQSGHAGAKGDRRESRSYTQRPSPYFFVNTPSNSSNGSLHAPAVSMGNLYPATTYYYQPEEYQVAAPSMWHLNRYNDGPMANISSSIAVGQFPPPILQQTIPASHVPMSSRRFSVASTSSAAHVHQPPPQRRRISVSKYQDIPPGNYLKVPSFQDLSNAYGVKRTPPHYVEMPASRTYVEYSSQTTPPLYSKGKEVSQSRRKSSSHMPPKSSSRQSRSVSRDTSRSQSPVENKSHALSRGVRTRSPSLERIGTPVPNTSNVPAFEFNSSHLPLRPPTINVHRYVEPNLFSSCYYNRYSLLSLISGDFTYGLFNCFSNYSRIF